MKKIIFTSIFILFLAFLYFFVNSTQLSGSLFVNLGKTGVIYENECATKTSICKIEVISNNESHSLLKVSYNYVKGIEDHTRLFFVANNGEFDNTVGVGDAYSLQEGKNTLNVKVGLHRSAPDFRDNPYKSSYLTLEVKGVDEVKNRYIYPYFIHITLDYKRSWYKPLSE